MEIKQSNRIQTSLINAAEKKLLVRLAGKMPGWVNSDHLTFLGFIGAIVICAGFVLSNDNIQWLWLANLGLFINWYGDSLDGSLARVRHQQRPIYGFYLDHTVDCINEIIMFVGAGLSAMMQNFTIAMLALMFYLLITNNVNVNAHLKGEYKLTYAKMGPTEFRMIVFAVNIVFMYVNPVRDFLTEWVLFGVPVLIGPFDLVGSFIVVILALMYFITVYKDAKYYSKIDPRPSREEGEDER